MKIYAVRKDGYWMMNYKFMGLKENVAGKGMQDIPVCLWGESVKDALLLDYQATAEKIAEAVGGKVEALTVR